MGVPKIPELEVKNSSHEEKKPWSRRLSARSMSKKLRRSMDSLHEVMTPRNSYPDYSNGAETNFQYFKRRLSARFGHDVSERKSRSSKETRQAPSTDSGSETVFKLPHKRLCLYLLRHQQFSESATRNCRISNMMEFQDLIRTRPKPPMCHRSLK